MLNIPIRHVSAATWGALAVRGDTKYLLSARDLAWDFARTCPIETRDGSGGPGYYVLYQWYNGNRMRFGSIDRERIGCLEWITKSGT